MTAMPPLIAHRGHASQYPENSWPAIEAALKSGVAAVEFDLQLTRDRVPVVIHDASLERTAARSGYVMDMTLAELEGVDIGERSRFGDRFADTPLMTLEALVARLLPWTSTFFVEIKGESTQRFGTDDCVRRVAEALEPIAQRCVLISFVERAVQVAKRHGLRTGWCLDYYDEDARALANVLAPDFLLADHLAIPKPPEMLWQGDWAWALWEVVDPARCAVLATQGADFIETMACAEMLAAAQANGAGAQ